MKHKKLMHTFYIIFGIMAVIAIVAAIFLSQPQFGRTARRERLARIQQSPHFKNEKFVNETPTTLMTGESGYLSTMKMWLFGEKPERLVPKEDEISIVKSDLKHLPQDKDLYVWFGHSSFLLQLSGNTFLVDPVFYKGSPVSFVNPMFPGTDYYKPSMMPDNIDYLIISHDHWDHLDYETVKELQPRVRHIVCPLGIGEDLECWGYSKEQIVEKDWNESFTADSISIHCLPTRHFSGRGPWNPKTMPASWLIETPQRKVFYTGDGGYSNRFKRFGKQFPDIDLAIMENGQYDEHWNQIHTMPYQLGKEVKELGTRRFITVHHSKFKLANHPWDEPRRNEQQASAESGTPVIVCKIGEIVHL